MVVLKEDSLPFQQFIIIIIITYVVKKRELFILKFLIKRK